MSEQKKDDKLYIPVNVVDRDDFLAGFGKKEIVITVSSAGIALAFILFTYSITQNIVIAIVPGALLVSGTIVMIRRDRFDESFVDKIRFLIRFLKVQKRFEYTYCNVLEEVKTRKKGN